MPRRFNPKTIRLAGVGVEKVLGELEGSIMTHLWRQPQTVRQIRDRLAREQRRISFNATMTVMNRLVSKGLLRRRRIGGVYRYEPRTSREAFSQAVTSDILTSLVRDPVLFSAAHFADLASDLDEKTMRRLRAFVKRRRR